MFLELSIQKLMKNKSTVLKKRKKENFLYLGSPEGKNSRKNILFFKICKESLIEVSERSERKIALVVKGYIPFPHPALTTFAFALLSDSYSMLELLTCYEYEQTDQPADPNHSCQNGSESAFPLSSRDAAGAVIFYNGSAGIRSQESHASLP